MTTKPVSPYVWVTRVSKVMARDQSCVRASWFRANFQDYEKMPLCTRPRLGGGPALLEKRWWPGRERVKGAPQARAGGIVTLDARVVATILACRVGGQAKGLPPTARGKG